MRNLIHPTYQPHRKISIDLANCRKIEQPIKLNLAHACLAAALVPHPRQSDPRLLRRLPDGAARGGRGHRHQPEDLQIGQTHEHGESTPAKGHEKTNDFGSIARKISFFMPRLKLLHQDLIDPIKNMTDQLVPSKNVAFDE